MNEHTPGKKKTNQREWSEGVWLCGSFVTFFLCCSCAHIVSICELGNNERYHLCGWHVISLRLRLHRFWFFLLFIISASFISDRPTNHTRGMSSSLTNHTHMSLYARATEWPAPTERGAWIKLKNLRDNSLQTMDGTKHFIRIESVQWEKCHLIDFFPTFNCTYTVFLLSF